MAKRFKQTDLLVDQLSAEERVEIIRADVTQALDDGRFRFIAGYLWKLGRGTIVPQGEFGGCAAAALAYAVAGSRPAAGKLYVEGATCREDAVDTGLITDGEAWELENGYEW